MIGRMSRLNDTFAGTAPESADAEPNIETNRSEKEVRGERTIMGQNTGEKPRSTSINTLEFLESKRGHRGVPVAPAAGCAPEISLPR